MEYCGKIPGEEIRQAYGLGEIKEITPLKRGTVARVWRVAAEAGDFLLRTLTGEEQGEREWTIFRHLEARNFRNMPAIRATQDGRSAVQAGDAWYQLQAFCSGVRPDPARPGTARRGAETALRLTEALTDCPAVAAQDRFDLARSWAAARRFWDSEAAGQPLSWADRAVERCCALPERERQVIHGDLGPWNLLETAQGMLVVDFGEARMGDPCFDLASVLAGFINHASEAERPRVLAEFLKCWKDVDRERLREQTALWTWRGVAQWLAGGEPALRAKMIGRFLFALSWLEGRL